MKNLSQSSFFAIDATPAYLCRLTGPSGIDNSAVPVPVVSACRSASAFIREHRGVQTVATMLAFGPCAVGVFLLRCEPELVALMFDVCEPGVRAWLDDGAQRRMLRIGLGDSEGVCVVDVSNSDVVDEMCAAAASHRPCTSEDLVRAFGTIVDALADSKGRESLDIGDMQIESATLALVTPREATPSANRRSAH